jgi:sec-independent protein translocase protein TatA
MFGLGWPEVVIILLIAVAVFGPKKIPQLGSAFGKTLRGLKDGLNQADEVEIDPDEEDRSR